MENDLTKFRTLPDELVHAIFEYLDYSELARVALTCSWGYERATPLLWKDLELKDKWTLHPKNERPQIAAHRCQDNRCDEHDDTPIVKKLTVLASKPHIASLVQTVLHRCHLPTPCIHSELPMFSFKSMVLSPDPRTRKLMSLAIWNMKNVHTLRIVYGHYNLTYVLIWGFLHPDRPRNIPLRRLWLESCSLALPRPTRLGSSHWPDLTGIESLRIRRLTILNDKTRAVLYRGVAPSRGKGRSTIQDGVGGEYSTYTSRIMDNGEVSLETMEDAWFYDDLTYRELPEAEEVLRSHELLRNAPRVFTGHEPVPPVTFLRYFLWDTTQTLTSLNLDMLLTFSCYQERDESDVHDLLNHLSTLRFPHLRAFQLRNATTPWSSLPKGTYLLDAREFAADFRTLSTSFLEFMEAHNRLQCLAWPMDRFFSQHGQKKAIVERRDGVIANLGRTLTELRVDIAFSDDPMVEGMAVFQTTPGGIARRRRFISWFAPHLKKLEVVKMEGAIPRNEKREIIRALHASPLKKIVMIGNSCPLGNLWDNKGLQSDLGFWGLPYENEEAISATLNEHPTLPDPDTEFKPSFDWPPSCSMAHTMASFHSQTINELKFCGYTGAPILYTPTSTAKTLLKPLRRFHALKRLTMSFWLDAYFEGTYRDQEVVSYWLDGRSPYSTALAVVSDAANEGTADSHGNAEAAPDISTRVENDDENDYDHIPNMVPPRPSHPDHVLTEVTMDPLIGPEPLIAIPTQAENRDHRSRPAPLSKWVDRLHALYTPRRMAEQVARQIGPALSDAAKRKPGGVLVRASFCLGVQAGLSAVWDIDVRIGAAKQTCRRNRKMGSNLMDVNGKMDAWRSGDEEEEKEKKEQENELETEQAKDKQNEVRHRWVDVLLDWDGPREETEPGRWWGKMTERSWF